MKSINRLWAMSLVISLCGFQSLSLRCQTQENGTSREKLLYNFNFGATGITISSPGVYKLAENIVFFPVAAKAHAITIASSDVLLDLQGFSIKQGNTVPTVEVIVVHPGTHSVLENVVIQDGFIGHITGTGISANQVNNLVIQNISCASCGLAGIDVKNTNGLFVNNCNVKSCCSVGNNFNSDDHLSCVLFESVSNGKIANCRIYNNRIPESEIAVPGLVGINMTNCNSLELHSVGSSANLCAGYTAFSLASCADCSLNSCFSHEDNGQGGATVMGFDIGSCNGISMSDCRVQGNTTGDHFFGIKLGSTTNSFIQKCSIINNNSNGPSAKGISLSFSSFNIIQDCVVSGNVSGYNLDAIEIINASSKNIMSRCMSVLNQAPSSICNGLIIDATSNNNMILDSNISENAGDNDDDSYGANVDSNGVGNVFINVRAYNNGAHEDHQLLGIPSASQVSLTSQAINGAAGPFVNASIVP